MENIFARHIKVVQILFIYCIIAQGYVVPEHRSLTKDAFQNKCNSIHHSSNSNVNLELEIFDLLSLSFKWTIKYIPIFLEGRSFNSPLKESSSLPVKKNENGLKDKKITANDIVDHVKSITTKLNKKLKKTPNNSSQKFIKSEHISFEKQKLKFVLTVYRWASDILMLNIIGETSLNEIFSSSLKYQPLLLAEQNNNRLKDYKTTADVIVKFIKSIIIQYKSEVYITTDVDNDTIGKGSSNKAFQPSLENQSPLPVEENDNRYKDDEIIANDIVELIEVIVIQLNTKLKSEETTTNADDDSSQKYIEERLNIQVFTVLMKAYQWILNLHHSNAISRSVDENFQPPLESQSSLPMEKNGDVSKDQEINIADVLRHKKKSIEDVNNISSQRMCRFEQITRTKFELKLFSYAWVSFEWINNINNINHPHVGGRSFDDMSQPSTEDPFAPNGTVAKMDGKDVKVALDNFVQHVKSIKHQLNVEQLNAELNAQFQKTARNIDNDASQKLWNIEISKQVNLENIQKMKYQQLKFMLTIYRWIYNVLILNTISEKTFFNEILNSSRKYQLLFHMQETDDELKDFEITGNEIIELVKLMQQT